MENSVMNMVKIIWIND